MNDDIAIGMSSGIGVGLFLGVLLIIGTYECRGILPKQLTDKHCQHIEARAEFEKCKQDFLGASK